MLWGPFHARGHGRLNSLLDCVHRRRRIELAWLWLRHQPNSPLSIWFRERVGTAKGRIRRIAIVAVARKLLIALWRYLETGVVPTATVLKV